MNFSAKELKEGGFAFEDLKAVGFPEWQLKQIGALPRTGKTSPQPSPRSRHGASPPASRRTAPAAKGMKGAAAAVQSVVV